MKNYLFYYQFGLVHHFTKLGSGEYYLEELEEEICPKRKREKIELLEEKVRKTRGASFALIHSLRTVNIKNMLIMHV